MDTDFKKIFVLIALTIPAVMMTNAIEELIPPFDPIPKLVISAIAIYLGYRYGLRG